MDISKHLNLINNHGYDGYIALYKGPKQMTVDKDEIVLVQNRKKSSVADVGLASVEWEKNHRTIEYPHSEKHIKENIEKNGHKGNITYCTCVGVPVKYLEKIKIEE